MLPQKQLDGMHVLLLSFSPLKIRDNSFNSSFWNVLIKFLSKGIAHGFIPFFNLFVSSNCPHAA